MNGPAERLSRREGAALTRLIGSGISLVLCPAFLLSACVWHVPTHLSVPTTGHVSDDGRATLQAEEVELRLEARNQRGRSIGVLWAPPGIPIFALPGSWLIRHRSDLPLYIYLDFRPSGPDFRFDPMAVRLRPQDGIPRSPEAYFGPGRGARVRRSWANFRCSAHQGKFKRSLQRQEFPLDYGKDRTCFLLEFPPLSADVRFTLTIEGLSRADQPVQLREVTFAKRAASAGRLIP